MEPASFVAPGEILQCSICLDTYTRPKMLPCQHTFCYACLLQVTGNRSSVKCPECREEHKLPPSGIKGFRENLVINNLLGLSPSGDELQCADCQQVFALSFCNHCNVKVCVECRVEHATLSSEVRIHLNSLKESVMSGSYKKKFRENKFNLGGNLKKIQLEQERMKAIFDRETQGVVERLTKRRRYFDRYFAMVTGIYRDLLRDTDDTEEVPSFVTDISVKLIQSDTIKALQQLKNELSDLKTATRLLETRDDEFKFVSESPLDVETFGRVEFGQAVVGINGAYDDGSGVDEGIHSDRSGSSFSSEKSGQKMMKNVETWTEFSAEPARASGSVGIVNEPASMTDASTLTEERYTSLPGAVSAADLSRDPLPAPYLQNQLPKNVDYKSKQRGKVVVIGRDNQEPGMRLQFPRNCAYHVARQELFVADSGNHRIMVYNTQGGNGHVFYNVNDPYDVAISDDGQHVYILHDNSSQLSNFVILKVNITGQLVKTIDSFPPGQLKSCFSLVYHNEHLAVMSSEHKCLIIYTDSGEYVRHFSVNNVGEVWSIAVDDDGKFYILDSTAGSVHIYTWHGQFTEKFDGQDTGSNSPGISVDGDGFVCVTRYDKHRVDVYDPRHHHVTSLGQPGQSSADVSQRSRGLCLIPDGRLVVVYRWNHRLQIL